MTCKLRLNRIVSLCIYFFYYRFPYHALFSFDSIILEGSSRTPILVVFGEGLVGASNSLPSVNILILGIKCRYEFCWNCLARYGTHNAGCRG